MLRADKNKQTETARLSTRLKIYTGYPRQRQKEGGEGGERRCISLLIVFCLAAFAQCKRITYISSLKHTLVVSRSITLSERARATGAPRLAMFTLSTFVRIARGFLGTGFRALITAHKSRRVKSHAEMLYCEDQK